MKSKHHIVPRFAGGDNNEDNLIIVSEQMHIALHKDRWNVLGRMGDYIAFKMMEGSLPYEEARREACRARMLRDNPAKKPEVRKKLSENNCQHRKEIRLKNSRAKKGKNNPWYGKKNPEHSKRMSGKGNPMYGVEVPKKECPFCGKIVDIRNYGRYHGQKCKKII